MPPEGEEGKQEYLGDKTAGVVLLAAEKHVPIGKVSMQDVEIV